MSDANDWDACKTEMHAVLAAHIHTGWPLTGASDSEMEGDGRGEWLGSDGQAAGRPGPHHRGRAAP